MIMLRTNLQTKQQLQGIYKGRSELQFLEGVNGGWFTPLCNLENSDFEEIMLTLESMPRELYVEMPRQL